MFRTNMNLIVILLLFSCASKKDSRSAQNKYDFLYGEIDKEKLYTKYPYWAEQEKAYTPDSKVISQISALNIQVDIFIFMASWCADSRRNVPIFFKAVEGNPNYNIKMWALNRKKQIDNGLHELYQIKRVPTFIFKYNDKEIGRITEFPKNTMVLDILEILNKI